MPRGEEARVSRGLTGSPGVVTLVFKTDRIDREPMREDGKAMQAQGRACANVLGQEAA